MKRGISEKPQGINKHNWYYENRNSIDVIHEVRNPLTGDFIRTDTIRIPLRRLEASIKRMKAEAAMNKRRLKTKER